jgi:hypothetical protein
MNGMDENLLEIREYNGVGYQALIDFDTWRVAILRWEETCLPENITTMERHVQTDEVFVLLQGQGKLILGGNSDVMDCRSASPWKGNCITSGRVFGTPSSSSRDASVLMWNRVIKTTQNIAR